jgi:hypothetical protein
VDISHHVCLFLSVLLAGVNRSDGTPPPTPCEFIWENCEFEYHVGGLRGQDVGCGCVGKEKKGYGPTRVGDMLRFYLPASFRRGIRQRARKM